MKEAVCRLSKDRRMELGVDLPWQGLFPKELAGNTGWAARTDTQRATQMALGKKNLDLL